MQCGAEDARGRHRTRCDAAGSERDIRWGHLVHLVQLIQSLDKALREALLFVRNAPVVEVLARGGSGDDPVAVLDDEPL